MDAAGMNDGGGPVGTRPRAGLDLDAQTRRELAAAVRGLHRAVEPNDVEQQFADALARVHGASDVLRFTLRRVEELEAWHREMRDVSGRRLDALEEQAIAAERQAEADEAAAAEAEQWLRQVHAAVLDRLSPPSAA